MGGARGITVSRSSPATSRIGCPLLMATPPRARIAAAKWMSPSDDNIAHLVGKVPSRCWHPKKARQEDVWPRTEQRAQSR